MWPDDIKSLRIGRKLVISGKAASVVIAGRGRRIEKCGFPTRQVVYYVGYGYKHEGDLIPAVPASIFGDGYEPARFETQNTVFVVYYRLKPSQGQNNYFCLPTQIVGTASGLRSASKHV